LITRDIENAYPAFDPVGESSGFSLHAGIAAKASQRDKLEHLFGLETTAVISRQGRTSGVPVFADRG
jgi:hypothetical protein